MNKFRKGSIVWDTIMKEFTKVLTSPGKGELPDGLTIASGKVKDNVLFGDYVLVHNNHHDLMIHKMTYCNRPCKVRHINQLIPRKEYLESLNQK